MKGAKTEPTNRLGECVMDTVECKEHAAECRRMAVRAPSSRVQAILMDMARTWDRLAIEAEIGTTYGAQN